MIITKKEISELRRKVASGGGYSEWDIKRVLDALDLALDIICVSADKLESAIERIQGHERGKSDIHPK